MSDVQCPASMCPLIAPKGSPWTGKYDTECPERDDPEDGGCPWWSMTCSCGGIQSQVNEAAANGGLVLIVGPNKPHIGFGREKNYDCPKAAVCSWQKQSGENLCPPRDAMSKGLDPRVCLF